LVNKIVLENSILSNSESCGGYPFNLQQFRDLIVTDQLPIEGKRPGSIQSSRLVITK
jgi:hypothetical protein